MVGTRPKNRLGKIPSGTKIDLTKTPPKKSPKPKISTMATPSDAPDTAAAPYSPEKATSAETEAAIDDIAPSPPLNTLAKKVQKKVAVKKEKLPEAAKKVETKAIASEAATFSDDPEVWGEETSDAKAKPAAEEEEEQDEEAKPAAEDDDEQEEEEAQEEEIQEEEVQEEEAQDDEEYAKEKGSETATTEKQSSSDVPVTKKRTRSESRLALSSSSHCAHDDVKGSVASHSFSLKEKSRDQGRR